MTRSVAVFLSVLIPLASATPATAGRPSGGLDWKPCAEDRTAQCAVLRVPVDWSDAYGAKIDLAVARRTATDPDHRIGALLVNPGGPGGSGVDFAIGAESFFSKTVNARFDIVGFDPRGVGRSSPVRCSASVLNAGPPALLTSQADYDAMIDHNRELAADCRENTGPVYAHADTISGVRDMDALRAALDQDQISFYGASYGTLLGAQYAERYPRRVRALALDSVMDHSVSTGEFLQTETDSAQAAFDEFVAWCDRDAICVLRGRDVRALWSSLLDRAADGDLANPYDPGAKLTVLDLISLAHSSFYQPQWYALAFFIKQADEGSALVEARSADLVDHSFPAVFCDDWEMPFDGYADFARRMTELRERAPDMIVSPLALAATVGCLGWESRAGNPQRRLRRTGTPTLLINSRYDPATPHVWARNVAAQLGPKATLLTYEGWGHVAYGRTDCVTDLVDRYLIDRVRPTSGTSCEGVLPDPFGVGKRAAPVVPRGRYR